MLKKNFSWYGNQILGDRDNQEDSYELIYKEDENYVLFIVADGMGGHQGGEEASQIAVKEFGNFFCASYPVKNISSKEKLGQILKNLKGALLSANKAIMDEIEGKPHLKGMGTTLLAVFLSDIGFTWISVGDSPLILVTNKEIFHLNEDHSMKPVLQEMVARGEMSEKEYLVNPHMSALRSVLTGDPKSMQYIDEQKDCYHLERGQCLLLASDGIESLSDDEIGTMTRKHLGGNTQLIVDELLEALQSGKFIRQDNATIINCVTSGING